MIWWTVPFAVWATTLPPPLSFLPALAPFELALLAAVGPVAAGPLLATAASCWRNACKRASSVPSEPQRPTTTPIATAIGSSAKKATAAARLPELPLACGRVSGRRARLLIAAK